MKIEPFKMKVTPEQSKRVQEILFENGYSWFDDSQNYTELGPEIYLVFYGLGNNKPKITWVVNKFDYYTDIPEISYQEFIDKYDFKLPEKWSIHPTTIEEAKVVGKYFDEHGLGIIKDGKFYERNAESILDIGISTYYGLTVFFKKITFEQFKKYVLKEETMERKIIGYKLIKPEYYQAACKLGFTNLSSRLGKNIAVADSTITSLREAGVLDLWFEPVYEEEKFNVGDWVTYKKEHIPPYTTQIQSIGHDGWIHSNINKPDEGHYHCSQYRKATSDEIKKAIKYTVGDWITIENSFELQSGCTGCPEGTFQVVRSPILDWRGLVESANGFFVRTPNNIWKISNIGVRKATPEEIEAARVFKMSFGGTTVTVREDEIMVGKNYPITYRQLGELVEMLVDDLPEIHGHRVELSTNSVIKVGCKSGTLEEVLAIYNKMKELQ